MKYKEIYELKVGDIIKLLYKYKILKINKSDDISFDLQSLKSKNTITIFKNHTLRGRVEVLLSRKEYFKQVNYQCFQRYQ